jgi:hypothetical protein
MVVRGWVRWWSSGAVQVGGAPFGCRLDVRGVYVDLPLSYLPQIVTSARAPAWQAKKLLAD